MTVFCIIIDIIICGCRIARRSSVMLT